VQLYAYGEPDGSTVKLGITRNSRTRKAQHERRGPTTTTMQTLGIWWAMPADESYLKRHFEKLAIEKTSEWFRCDAAMRAWLIEMRKQHFVAHDEDEIDDMPFVDSSAWLPGTSSAVAVSAAGQLALNLAAVTAGDGWADVTVVRDKVGDGDFYSPPDLLSAARKALGSIDLDPASCRVANREVQAKRYYSWHEDGLTQAWFGRMWINPPFPWEAWAEKFVHEWDAGNIEAAVILCTTRVTTAKYFHDMVSRASAMLKMRGRVQFWGPKAGAPDEGHELYFYGRDVAAFSREFLPFGRIFVPRQIELPKPIVQQLSLTPDEDAADSLGSFHVAIDAIGERVKAGEPLPTTGYFARGNR
jgi:hypothetical protein